jgi:hypothetical protein
MDDKRKPKAAWDDEPTPLCEKERKKIKHKWERQAPLEDE